MDAIHETVMSQYANSPTIMKLIEGMNEIIDPAVNISDFYNLIWDVSSANGLGLDAWGRIVGVDRNAKMITPEVNVFGFKTSPLSFKPFNQAPFMGSEANFSTYKLKDTDYRKLIMVKAASNIVYATAPNINRFLKLVFDKRCYFLLTGPMQATYFFEFKLNYFESYMVHSLQILPIPCGVSIEMFEKEEWTNLLEHLVNVDIPDTLPFE